MSNYELLKSIKGVSGITAYNFYNVVYCNGLTGTYNGLTGYIRITGTPGFIKNKIETQQKRMINDYLIPLFYLIYGFIFQKYYTLEQKKNIYIENDLNYKMYNYFFDYNNPTIKRVNIYFYKKFTEKEKNKSSDNIYILNDLINEKYSTISFLDNLIQIIKNNDDSYKTIDIYNNIIEEFVKLVGTNMYEVTKLLNKIKNNISNSIESSSFTSNNISGMTEINNEITKYIEIGTTSASSTSGTNGITRYTQNNSKFISNIKKLDLNNIFTNIGITGPNNLTNLNENKLYDLINILSLEKNYEIYNIYKNELNSINVYYNNIIKNINTININIINLKNDQPLIDLENISVKNIYSNFYNIYQKYYDNKNKNTETKNLIDKITELKKDNNLEIELYTDFFNFIQKNSNQELDNNKKTKKNNKIEIFMKEIENNYKLKINTINEILNILYLLIEKSPKEYTTTPLPIPYFYAKFDVTSIIGITAISNISIKDLSESIKKLEDEDQYNSKFEYLLQLLFMSLSINERLENNYLIYLKNYLIKKPNINSDILNFEDINDLEFTFLNKFVEYKKSSIKNNNLILKYTETKNKNIQNFIENNIVEIDKTKNNKNNSNNTKKLGEDKIKLNAELNELKSNLKVLNDQLNEFNKTKFNSINTIYTKAQSKINIAKNKIIEIYIVEVLKIYKIINYTIFENKITLNNPITPISPSSTFPTFPFVASGATSPVDILFENTPDIDYNTNIKDLFDNVSKKYQEYLVNLSSSIQPSKLNDFKDNIKKELKKIYSLSSTNIKTYDKIYKEYINTITNNSKRTNFKNEDIFTQIFEIYNKYKDDQETYKIKIDTSKTSINIKNKEIEQIDKTLNFKKFRQNLLNDKKVLFEKLQTALNTSITNIKTNSNKIQNNVQDKIKTPIVNEFNILNETSKKINDTIIKLQEKNSNNKLCFLYNLKNKKFNKLYNNFEKQYKYIYTIASDTGKKTNNNTTHNTSPVINSNNVASTDSSIITKNILDISNSSSMDEKSLFNDIIKNITDYFKTNNTKDFMNLLLINNNVNTINEVNKIKPFFDVYKVYHDKLISKINLLINKINSNEYQLRNIINKQTLQTFDNIIENKKNKLDKIKLECDKIKNIKMGKITKIIPYTDVLFGYFIRLLIIIDFLTFFYS